MPEIRYEQVSLAFDTTVVLREISLTLTEHRIGIVGANGSGKSTLARLINGLVTPTRGTVSVNGLDVTKHGAKVRGQVGFMFTNPDSQIIMPTPREDVALSLRRSKRSAAERATRTTELLTQFQLEAVADQPAHKLSGGQKQLLALASVTATEPQILVADEPTTLLDARNARLIAERFAALSQQLVLVTHQLETVRDFDRVLVVEGGQIVADDAPAAALAHYRQLIERA